MALSATQPEKLEEVLTASLYLAGEKLTSLDAQVFRELSSNPPTPAFPHLWSWYGFVNMFAPSVRSSWPEPPKKEEPAAEEEEDVDLFADDPEAEEAAKKQAEEKKKAKKPEPVGKSSLLLEVKPTASSVDLDALAQKIMSEVTGPAIKWIVEYKKVPVAFGIFKLVIGCIVEDTVSTDSIIEQIQEMKGLVEASDEEEEEEDGEGEAPKEAGEKELVEGELVQSVDIQAFNKL
jgi:elongation factor 1-beta